VYGVEVLIGNEFLPLTHWILFFAHITDHVFPELLEPSKVRPEGILDKSVLDILILSTKLGVGKDSINPSPYTSHLHEVSDWSQLQMVDDWEEFPDWEELPDWEVGPVGEEEFPDWEELPDWEVGPVGEEGVFVIILRV
jgi:hypothetical protein